MMEFKPVEDFIVSLGVAPEDQDKIVRNVSEMMKERVDQMEKLLLTLQDEIGEMVERNDRDITKAVSFNLVKIYNPKVITPKLYYIAREFVKDETVAWMIAGYLFGMTKSYFSETMKKFIGKIAMSKIEEKFNESNIN